MIISNPLSYCGPNNEYMVGLHFEPVPLNICISCKNELKPHSEEYNDPLGFGHFLRYAQDTGYCKECTLQHKKNDTGELFTRFVEYERNAPYKVKDIGNEQKAYFKIGDPSQIFQKEPHQNNLQLTRRLAND